MDKQMLIYPLPCAFGNAPESTQPILHFLNLIGKKLGMGPMHSKINGSYNGGGRLGALRSVTERTGERIYQTLSQVHWFPYHHVSGFPGFLIF